jgi:two-component system sensor histidine kinase AtoS
VQNRHKHASRRFARVALSLRQKFLLAFVGLVLGLTIGLLLIVQSRQGASIVRQMEKRGITIAAQLAAVSTRSLLTYNFVALEQDAEKISRDPDVLYAIILDREGRVAAYSGHDEQQGMILQDAVSQRAAQAPKTLIQRVEEPHRPAHYDIAVPVFVEEDKWGTVRIGLSLQDMHAEMYKTRQWVLFLGAVGVLLGTLAAAFLAQRIAAPIRVLTESTMAVARGEFLPAIHVRTRDEIAVLAANFNAMTEDLRKHHAALEETNRQLDQKVHELSILANYNASILSSMTSGLFTLTLDGRFEMFNTMAETITGLSEEHVRGQHYQHVFADNASFVQVLDASHRHHTPLTAPRLDFCRHEGRRVPLQLRTAVLQGRDGLTVGLLAIFEDLSPIQTLESQLRRADRLATVGQVAAGLAHEIKNPLASIRTFAQLVSRKYHDRKFVEQFDRVVPQELDRVNGIVEELLELARPARLRYAPVSIQVILERIIDVYAEHLHQQQIVCKLDVDAALPLLQADAEQLRRAFANIVLNAIEAMPEGGELRLTGRPVPTSLFNVVSSSTDEARSETREEASLTLDQYATAVEVVCCDTGGGIPANQLDALFTPFYTTKPKGTGLGLALTLKIIEEHRGTIRIASEVGHGTVVTVLLPTSPKVATSAQIS